MTILKDLMDRDKVVKKTFRCDWDLWLIRLFKKLFLKE